MKAEIVKEVTGVNISLNLKEGRDMYAALDHMCRKIGISGIDDRPDHPELKPLYYLYDLLHEGGFDS